jgi:hypothetical protein
VGCGLVEFRFPTYLHACRVMMSYSRVSSLMERAFILHTKFPFKTFELTRKVSNANMLRCWVRCGAEELDRCTLVRSRRHAMVCDMDMYIE